MPKKHKPSGATQVGAPRDDTTLRSVSKSPTLFWSATSPKHLYPTIRDKSAFGGHRDLAENEMATMALNEIAAKRGRGFFFHFRNRDSRKKSVGKGNTSLVAKEGEICPASRAPPTNLSPEMPTIAFMDFVWDQQLQKGFLESSHRSRYLKCDGQINLPYGATPLYGIQYTANSRYALYVTSSPSFVVLATQSTIYLASTSELDILIGRWPTKKSKPSGPSPELRLNTAAYMWFTGTDKAKMNTTERQIQESMAQMHEVGNVMGLYDRIINICTSGNMKPTFTADQVRDMAPRPEQPETGIPLGTPLQISNPSDDVINGSSNPPSRRGGRLSRIKRRCYVKNVDSDEQEDAREDIEGGVDID